MCRLWAATGDGFMNRIVRLLADGSRIAAIFLPQKCPPPFDDGHVTFKYLPEPKLRHANSWHSSVLPGAVTTRLHQHLTRRRFLCAAQTKLEAASHQVPPKSHQSPSAIYCSKDFHSLASISAAGRQKESQFNPVMTHDQPSQLPPFLIRDECRAHWAWHFHQLFPVRRQFMAPNRVVSTRAFHSADFKSALDFHTFAFSTFESLWASNFIHFAWSVDFISNFNRRLLKFKYGK